MVAAAPNASPLTSALGQCDASSLVAPASAATPIRSHISAGTWFIIVPARKARNGAKAKSARASMRVSARGSSTRNDIPHAPTATAAHSGPISHGAPNASPIASIAGPPGGNCPYTRSVTSTRW